MLSSALKSSDDQIGINMWGHVDEVTVHFYAHL